MVKRLAKHGNSYALIIDQAILEHLKIEPDSLVDVRTEGDTLKVRRSDELTRQEKVADSLKNVNQRYEHALKRLAE